MMVIEQLAKEDALKGLTSAALAVHQNGVPVKYHNDHQKGRPLLWLMVMDAELQFVNGKPVIKLAGVDPVPEAGAPAEGKVTAR